MLISRRLQFLLGQTRARRNFKAVARSRRQFVYLELPLLSPHQPYGFVVVILNASWYISSLNFSALKLNFARANTHGSFLLSPFANFVTDVLREYLYRLNDRLVTHQTTPLMLGKLTRLKLYRKILLCDPKSTCAERYLTDENHCFKQK